MTTTSTHDQMHDHTNDRAQDHLVAVVDPSDRDGTLSVARSTVRAGGRATLVVDLGPTDRRHIREFAEAEHISTGEAESRYLAALDGDIRRQVGDDTVIHVTGPAGTSARGIASIAGDATQVAIPSALAGRRDWKRALRRGPLPVTVVPRAA